MTTRRTPKWEETRAGVGDSRDSTVLADPSRDATVDARHGRRPSGLGAGHTVGRYTILSVIGRGGMGTVYAAHDPKLDRKVALKVLHDEHIADGAERLVREAQALARLADPRVVTIFDAGEIDGHVYLAMQLVDGETLAEALERDPSIAQILAWFVEAGKGLMAAHAVGLVHRDFKPTNVLIDRAGKVAVTDFGLARDLVVPERGLTAVNTIVGTPAYMSPEQHAQQPITEASDQFSFCVALWEALFDQHPYLEAASRDSMSPFAIGYAIYDAPLIPAPKRTRVPRSVIDALMRGLAREPAERWPSMAALVEVLVPPIKRRVWPVAVAATVLAAGAAGAGVWLFLTNRNDMSRPSCTTEASDRMTSTWSTATAKKLADHFAATSKPYATTSAAAASSALDRYAARWQASVADVCAAERAAPSDRSARRAACLDGRLDALRTVVAKLTIEDRVENVDRAQPIVDGLPDLADCIDPDMAAPPADLAAKVAPVDTEIQTAINRGNGGDFTHARTDLEGIVKRADAIGWPPLQARAHLALGGQLMQMLVPARDELLKAAELATANHLDREAARAWQYAVRSAGFEKSADAVAVLAPVARGSAARLHDPALIYGAEVAYGRALVRLRRYKDGADICRAALAAAQNKVEGTVVVDQARDCLVEALVPLGAYTELEPLLAQVIAERTKKLGPDHPTVTDYLGVQEGMNLRRGKIDEAYATAKRVLEIRQRVYPAGHVKIAEALHELANVEAARGNTKESIDDNTKALAIASEAQPEPLVMINAIHVSLGFAAAQADDHAGAVKHFEQAVALTRKSVGSDSLELAILLLNFGQIKAEDNLEAGLGLLGEAKTILDRLHDKRAGAAGAVSAVILAKHKRWPEARKLLEEAVAHADIDTDPENLGEMKWTLAQAIVETHGERARAKKLATEAKELLATGGASQAGVIKVIDQWLAKH